MSTNRNRVIKEYINDNYPNAKIVSYDEGSSECDLVFYDDEEIKKLRGDWFPLCCYRDKKTGKLTYGGRGKVYHTYTEGETGAGKTTRFVMQSIRALSMTAEKPSFVIVDIHGEIIENLYIHLKKMGYDIKILNCDDPARSDTYNPLEKIAVECYESGEIENDALNSIRRMSEIIQPVESRSDPVWDRGARSYTNGSILDKFEDLIAGDIPLSCMTIYNIIQNHHWLRQIIDNGYNSDGISRVSHYRKKRDALSVQKLIAVTNAAEKTRASYYGVVENHYDTFGQPAFYRLSSNSTISIDGFIDRPTAIVIQSGSTRIGDDLISLLMNDIYTAAVRTGKSSPCKMLPRKIHCFLDEFANCNIADGPEYIKMLTTSRKFGMYWHMILQCDAQLDRKYDANIARIIRANSTEIFMGSQDYSTQLRFAKSCGQKTVEQLGSEMRQQEPAFATLDLMTTDKLDSTGEGYIYVKSPRHPILRSFIEAFYNCPEFETDGNIDAVYPHNDFDYRSTCFYVDEIPAAISSEAYELVKYIGPEKMKKRDIIRKYGAPNTAELLARLEAKNIISRDANDVVSVELNMRQLELLEFRYEHGLMKETGPHRTGRGQRSSREIRDILFGAEVDENDEEDDDEVFGSDDADVDYIDFSDIIGAASRERVVTCCEDDTDDMEHELRCYLADNEIDVTASDFAGITCIPDDMNEFFCACEASRDPAHCPWPSELPTTGSLLKCAIIEAYLRRNDYADIDKWSEGISAEVEKISNSGYFPQTMIDIFNSAAKAVGTELDIENIRELKKMLNA